MHVLGPRFVYRCIFLSFSKNMYKNNALAALNDYGGNSSEDEVPGPRVSTKRTFKEDEDVEQQPKKHLRRLPVPEQFTHKCKTDEHADDPILHQGRIRIFAHERGNWATFVYIPFEARMGIEALFSYIQGILSKSIDLNIQDNFHISLTQTVILRHHWIESFVTTLRENLRHFKKFNILFDTVKVYCNDERTRTFLGMHIKIGHDSLLQLVKAIDNCSGDFQLSGYYENPSFHMSIAWCTGDCQTEIRQFLPEINQRLEQLKINYPEENWFIFVEALLCKIGNKYFSFPLA